MLYYTVAGTGGSGRLMRASGNGKLAVDRRLQTDLVNNHNSARRQLLSPFLA